ncbi:putative retinol dehydrogenase 12 [Diaporthe ampelina]|uniref:Putative retinol dehydrogenase 12 n=1 Tax=Diaporthe ampelina TaxID=1214573 RepID=A0A0G2FUL0_9PEZI|nr:putative retinol dehydrogenase 12 [Diaporthe ampelina]
MCLAIIAGSNTGVGFETARQLLELGPTRLILAVRDEIKGKAAASRLSEAHKLAEGTAIEVWPLDLSLTGHDEVIQVNYLSTALLAILLLPVVEERRANQPRPSRITLTLSEVASWTKFNEQKEPGSLLEALDSKRGKVDMLDRMWLSKLLGQFLPVRLAAAVPPSAAVINGASPGAVHDSEFNRDFYKTFGGAVFKKLVLKHVGNSSEMAAWAITDATSSTTFVYYSMAPIVSTEVGKKLSDRLWKETMEELSFANVEEILRRVKDKE